MNELEKAMRELLEKIGVEPADIDKLVAEAVRVMKMGVAHASR